MNQEDQQCQKLILWKTNKIDKPGEIDQDKKDRKTIYKKWQKGYHCRYSSD